MKPVGVAKLKAHLSRYLGHVMNGQEVIVTERGLPVAKIVPLRAEWLDSRRERLARPGLLQLGSGRISPMLLKPPKGPRRGFGVLKALLEERAEGR